MILVLHEWREVSRPSLHIHMDLIAYMSTANPNLQVKLCAMQTLHSMAYSLAALIMHYSYSRFMPESSKFLHALGWNYVVP